jgi:hypothetical protein
VDWVIALALVALCGIAMVGLGLFARRVRRRGVAGQAIAAAMAAYDEGLHSAAHDTFVELRAQDERAPATPSPGKRHASGT